MAKIKVANPVIEIDGGACGAVWADVTAARDTVTRPVTKLKIVIRYTVIGHFLCIS